MKKLLLIPSLVIFVCGTALCQFTATVSNALCYDSCNGRAAITPAGNYRYLWDDGHTYQTDSNLCFGGHYCVVYDSAGNYLDTVRAGVLQPNPMMESFVVTNVTCYGGSNGQLTIIVSGGTPNYTCFWSNGATTQTITGLSAGVYNWTLTDMNGCTVTGTDTITGPASMTATSLDTTIYVACNNTSISAPDPTVYGGIPPYSYIWGNGATTCMGNCTGPGVYFVTITDANGCRLYGSDTIAATASLPSLYPQVTYLPSCNANITLSASGGVRPFTYAVNGLTLPDSVYANQAPGSYYVDVTDSNLCQTGTTVIIGPVIDSLQINYPTCDHPDTGVISIYVNGVSGPVTYRWNNGDTAFYLSHLAAGNYSVTVTDSAGCTAAHIYNLPGNGNQGYYPFLTVTNANCNVANGAVSAITTGGYPPYSYQWNTVPEQTSAIATGLSAGQYSVTVTDSLGCITTGTATVNFNCSNVITGIIFRDLNRNCIFDSTEQLLDNLLVEAVSSTGQSYYGTTGTFGGYSITVPDTGIYTVIAEANQTGACTNIEVCNNNQAIDFHQQGDTVFNYNFGIGTGSGFDLAMHPGWTPANPGFEKDYWIFYYNQAPLLFSGSATVTFQYDSNLIFLGSNTPYTTYSAATHTLTWIVDTVNYWTRIGNIRFAVPSTLSLSYQLQSDFKIEPYAGDCDTSNNEMHFSEIVTGSHDPNEKTVSPAGPVTEADSVLTYTIHFQNTGTDSTHFVIIKDTLSPNLDPATVRNIASSDKYSSFTVSGKGILTWTFNPLRIVDSITNPSGSKRFIMFTVKKKANLPIGTTISNKAAIYFDYNPAVVTNTVTDTASWPLYIFEVSSNPEISVKALPNPFNDVTHIVVNGLNEKFGFELYDVTGRLQQSIPSIDNSQFDVRKGTLSKGVYLYRIIVTGKPAAFGKLVVE